MTTDANVTDLTDKVRRVHSSTQGSSSRTANHEVPVTTRTNPDPITRKRRPRGTVPCTVCGEPTKLGTVCDNCTQNDSINEETYLAALRKDDTALAALTLLSPTERKRIAPTFLSPDALTSFVKDGMITSQHLTDLYPLRRKDYIVTTATATKTTARKRTPRKARAIDQDQVDAAKVDTAPKPKTARATKAKAPTVAETIVKGEGLTAASVARDNSLDARKFRSFLRAQGIDRTFSTKAAATKAVRAFKAATK